MTPSPGGTSCLENAEIDMRTIVKHLGATIDDVKHNADDFAGAVISGENAT